MDSSMQDQVVTYVARFLIDCEAVSQEEIEEWKDRLRNWMRSHPLQLRTQPERSQPQRGSLQRPRSRLQPDDDVPDEFKSAKNGKVLQYGSWLAVLVSAMNPKTKSVIGDGHTLTCHSLLLQQIADMEFTIGTNLNVGSKTKFAQMYDPEMWDGKTMSVVEAKEELTALLGGNMFAITAGLRAVFGAQLENVYNEHIGKPLVASTPASTRASTRASSPVHASSSNVSSDDGRKTKEDQLEKQMAEMQKQMQMFMAMMTQKPAEPEQKPAEPEPAEPETAEPETKAETETETETDVQALDDDDLM